VTCAYDAPGLSGSTSTTPRSRASYPYSGPACPAPTTTTSYAPAWSSQVLYDSGLGFGGHDTYLRDQPRFGPGRRFASCLPVTLSSSATNPFDPSGRPVRSWRRISSHASSLSRRYELQSSTMSSNAFASTRRSSFPARCARALECFHSRGPLTIFARTGTTRSDPGTGARASPRGS
jgi:hypothetical protein